MGRMTETMTAAASGKLGTIESRMRQRRKDAQPVFEITMEKHAIPDLYQLAKEHLTEDWGVLRGYAYCMEMNPAWALSRHFTNVIFGYDETEPSDEFFRKVRLMVYDFMTEEPEAHTNDQ